MVSSDLSPEGSLPRPSRLSRSPLMKVPWEVFVSLKKIYLHDPVDRHNRTKEPCINDTPSLDLPLLLNLGVHSRPWSQSSQRNRCGNGACIGQSSDHGVLAVDVVDERVGILLCIANARLHISSKWLSSGVRAGYY
jgi:hypothetical protein